MKKFLPVIMALFIFCGCGKQEDSMLPGGDSVPQEETMQPETSMPQGEDFQQMANENNSDEFQIYKRLNALSWTSVEDYPDGRASLTGEEASGSCWKFAFDDELDVALYNVDISIKIEMLEELWAKYTIYKDSEELHSFEANISHEPPDMMALYVDITQDGSRDVVIIGSLDSGGFEPTPWTYAYDLKNNEQISLFDSDGVCSSLTEKQREQAKSVLDKDEKFSKLLPNAKIWEVDSTLSGIPMVDALGNVYFDLPIPGERYAADVCGNALLLLTYNADTKEFDVCDIVYYVKPIQ